MTTQIRIIYKKISVFKLSSVKENSENCIHTSSLEISSLLKVRPGITPRFFNQKMDANEPEKKIPSTAANATTRSPYVESSSSIHLMAQSAFLFTHGMVSMALNKYSLEKQTQLLV